MCELWPSSCLVGSFRGQHGQQVLSRGLGNTRGCNLSSSVLARSQLTIHQQQLPLGVVAMLWLQQQTPSAVASCTPRLPDCKLDLQVWTARSCCSCMG